MVGISVLTLAPGHVGGSETYVRELLRGLAREGTLGYRVVAPPAAEDVGAGLPTEVAPEWRSGVGQAGRLRALVMGVTRPGPLRRRLEGAALVHYPLTVRVPTVPVPSVVTLHDVQHRDLPGLFSRAERAYRSVAYDAGSRHADRVIVLSEFTRRRAIETLGLSPNSVRVVHSGVDHERFHPGADEREPFVLYPARPWPHKNHRRLFEAFAIVRRERPELRLVLTGGGGLGSLPDGVEGRGRVDDAQLAELYRRASALVFPSLYEGFGQPPLEAMASGCPVACSDAAALPEIVGDAARLFDPHDAQAIAAAVNDVLADPDTWSRRGLEHAARFSWDATARATEDVYRELL